MCKSYLFFKQKTAYEIPKRDWSSDVCSSDLTPRLRLEAQQAELDRQGFEMRFDIAVDARAIAFQNREFVFGEEGQRRDGRAAYAEEAEEIIEIRQGLSTEVDGKIAGKPPVAENLRGAPAQRAAVELHLPEPLLRVQISLREKEIAYVFGVNVRNAVRCPGDFYGGFKTGEKNLAAIAGRARAQPATQQRNEKR